MSHGFGELDVDQAVHAEDVAHASGDKGLLLLAVRKDSAAAVAADGDYIALIVDANGRLHVLDQNSAAIKAQTDKLTFIAGNVLSVSLGSSVSNSALLITGDEAHDAADAGSPVKIGSKALDLAESPTAVAKDDRVQAAFDRHGVQYVIGGHPNAQTAAGQRTGSGNTTAIAAPGAGKRIVITRLSAYSKNSSANDCQAKFLFNGGSTIAEHDGVAPGSGFVEGNGAGILGVGGDNTAFDFTTDAAADVNYNVTYYIMDG